MAQVINPIEQFSDTSGNPLNSGYVYIGTANLNPETNPVAVYWDSGYTTPAAQPLRTSGGYIYRNGVPAQVYLASAGNYSITIRDHAGALVRSLSSFSMTDSSSTANISGGASGSLPYQTAASTTGMLPVGTNGQILTLAGGIPTWASTSSSYDATNVAITGGTINGTTLGATTRSSARFTTVNASSTITPNTVAGIVGTTLGDSAQAGSVGEVITRKLTFTAFVSTSINIELYVDLTAGHWMVFGSFMVSPAGGTTITRVTAGLEDTPGLPVVPYFATVGLVSSLGNYFGYPFPTRLFNYTAGATRVYGVVNPVFSGGTATCDGVLTAVRIR